MRLDRAAMVLRRVLGIGLSWALVWFVFWALIWIPNPESISLGKVVRGFGLMSLLLGIPFGVAHEVVGRGRRASELSLTRTLVCAFLACAFEQIVFLGYLEYRDPGLGLGLGTSVQLALGLCVIGQFVTLAWYAAVRGVARALAPAGTLARLQPGPMALLVVIDFVVILLACWLGNATTFFDHPSVWEYSGSILLTATATVVCFYGCGMYHPPRRVGREQVLAIALTTAISFLIMFMVIAVLQVGGDPGRDVFPGLSLPMAFAYLFVLTVASRLAWVSVIEHMPSHRPRPG